MNINFHFPFHQILHFELHYKKPGKFGCIQDHDVAYFTRGEFFRRVFEDSIDDIPSATAPIDEFNCCDVCKRKDEKFKYAQMYCVVCAKKLCDSHLKVRNAVFCGFFSCPIVDYCSIKYLFALEASFNSCRVCFPSFFFACI